MTVTYVDCQANIYRLIRTDFWEQSVYVLIFENNPYMYWFLRIIRTCTDFSYKFLIKILIPRKIRVYTGTDVWVWKIQKWRNFHGMVQCYRLMLRIAVTLRSNLLHLVTSLRTALVIQWCYITVLHYGVTLHVFIQLYTLKMTTLCHTIWLGHVRNMQTLMVSY